MKTLAILATCVALAACSKSNGTSATASADDTAGPATGVVVTVSDATSSQDAGNATELVSDLHANGVFGVINLAAETQTYSVRELDCATSCAMTLMDGTVKQLAQDQSDAIAGWLDENSVPTLQGAGDATWQITNLSCVVRVSNPTPTECTMTAVTAN